MSEAKQPPKLFISYSWTTPEHEDRVLRWATELRESGIDVVFDKWDLQEGNDAVAFMEKMVSDPDIKKVAMFCDRGYVEKTNQRKGGVGTEAQIISKNVYEAADQNKFVAVVCERDENGKVQVPIYYQSRIHIDFSDPSKFSDEFDRLIRWVFDKRLYQKPEIGKPPEFLQDEGTSAKMATSVVFRRAIDALKTGKSTTAGAIDDYLATFSQELQNFRIEESGEHFDDHFIKNINDFIPYRNQFQEFTETLARYHGGLEIGSHFHPFFEKLIPYLDHDGGSGSYRLTDFDNYRFLIHELLLTTIATLIHHRAFNVVSYLLSTDYYSPIRHNRPIHTYSTFQRGIDTLRERNERLKLNRLSLWADLLKERCTGTQLSFELLMQADFILYLRSYSDSARASMWWPMSLLYATERNYPFEIFARSRSRRFFDSIKSMINVDDKEGLGRLISNMKENRCIPSWDSFHCVTLTGLTGYDELCLTE